MKVASRLGAICIGTALLANVQAARAAVDLNGVFHVEATVPLLFNPVTCSVTFVQSAPDLSASGSCDFIGAVSFPTGSIDSTTGAFTLNGTAPAFCPSLVITGTGAQDSQTFTGTLSCTGGPIPVTAPVVGSRCGNGLLDPGEQCDDGNRTNGDCCSSTCQFEAAGSSCPADPNPCTDDVCNATGVCTHPNNTAPCDDGFQCTTGDVCGGGSCHGAFVASGTTCDDDDPCTVGDQCDGAGTCVPGTGELDCGACMDCVNGFGCSAVGLVDTQCKVPTLPASAPLSISDRTPDVHDKLSWKLVRGTATDLAEFGDPRTATSYKVCIFDQEFGGGYDHALLGAEVQAGGMCDGRPCWTGTPKGYKFKSKNGNDDGITQVQLVAGPRGKTKIVVTGKGANLHPPSLPIDLSSPILFQVQAANGSCWQAEYASAPKNNPVAFKAKGSSPSGAFLD